MKKVIYKTIKDNIKIINTTGVLAIDMNKIQNEKTFSQTLKYLQSKGYITYSTSFISIMIKLTDKGRVHISKGIEFK